MSGSDLNALFLSTYLILTNNTTGEVLLLSVSQKGWRTWPKSHAGGSGAGIRNLRGWFWNVCFSQCCSDLKSLQTACVYVSLYIFRLTPLGYSLHTIKCSYFFSGMSVDMHTHVTTPPWKYHPFSLALVVLHRLSSCQVTTGILALIFWPSWEFGCLMNHNEKVLKRKYF